MEENCKIFESDSQPELKEFILKNVRDKRSFLIPIIGNSLSLLFVFMKENELEINNTLIVILAAVFIYSFFEIYRIKKRVLRKCLLYIYEIEIGEHLTVLNYSISYGFLFTNVRLTPNRILVHKLETVGITKSKVIDKELILYTKERNYRFPSNEALLKEAESKVVEFINTQVAK